MFKNITLVNNSVFYSKKYFSDTGWYFQYTGKDEIPCEDINVNDVNPYFDCDFYSKKYKVNKNQAIDHFFKKGEAKGYAPSSQLEGYLSIIIKSYGKKWFRKFIKLNERLKFLDYAKLTDKQKSFEIYRSGLLDNDWYLASHSDLTNSGVNSLVHFSLYGLNEGRSPNQIFDVNWYREKFLESISNESPLIHYLKNWKEMDLSPGESFSSKVYLQDHLDVNISGMEPLKHYLAHGKREGRQIRGSKFESKDYDILENSPCFLKDWYLNINEDLRGSGIDPVEHYILFGEKEGRKPNPYFDPTWYSKCTGLDDKNLLVDYLQRGHRDGVSPSESFDANAYIEVNELVEINNSVLEHYLLHGKKLGYLLTPCSKREASLTEDSSSQLVTDPSLRAFIDQKPVELKPKSKVYSEDALEIHWVMPDFAIGAGGHMTIFRTIRWLEVFGHKNVIWIYNQSMHSTPKDAYEDIIKGFQLVKSEVKFVDESFKEASGDAIFATDWGSVNYVVARENFKRRFYFVQDHEPEFYAMGSHKLAAMQTYKYDLDCICAGPWLSELMEKEYGLWADNFWLAVDNAIYNTENITRLNSKKVFKIAFYARHFTARRAVELGLLALEQLGKSGLKIEVHTFGAPLETNKAPFKLIDHGICTPAELADIYKDCDLGMVFSATNYSLIPQEMMACGLPVAEIDTESTRAVFPDKVVTYLSPNPRIMCEQLQGLAFKYKQLQKQADAALVWVNQFSWEKSARIVENGIKNRLDHHKFKPAKNIRKNGVHASVIIPTYNGGEEFLAVIDKVMTQIAPWNYEVVIVDSGSTDGTIEKIKQYPQIKLFEIDSKDFQHGRTRNFAISKCSGEFVAVLTHDALPADNYWLYNLVSLLEAHPNAAGAFGKHFAYPHADPYTKRDLDTHFKGFDDLPISLSKFTDEVRFESGDLGWRQVLHFYSDNNSCMRKSVWKKLPYPEVNFGEDQAWADLIIKEGYEKLYVKDAAVFHSHDFDEGNVEKRASEEAQFFKEEFGYTMIENDKIEETIRNLNDSDQQWGSEKGLDKKMIERRVKSNRAKIIGFSKVNS